MKPYKSLRPAAIAALAIAVAPLAGSGYGQPVASPAPEPSPREEIDWRTAPITPGEWRWSNEGGQSVARYAGGLLVLSCDRRAGKVTLLRSGSASGPVPMTIVTSSVERPVTGSARSTPAPAIAATFDAGDPLLDAMTFSRGRFAVETAGLPTLYVPSWPEVSRVVEDCR
jgi:hypothetical protein